MTFKIVVNFVQRMVNKLWRLKMFINHPLNVINHICTALTIQFDVEIQFQICVSKHGVDHSISNLCVKISSLILIFSWYYAQSYTQYIPLPLNDLDSWLKTPSIYVFDCSAAGKVVNAFIQVFIQNHFYWMLYKKTSNISVLIF